MQVPHGRWRPAVLGLGLVVCAAATGAAAQPATGCDQPPGFYEGQGYVIRQIAIGSPFDFLRPIRRSLDAAVADLRVQAGQPYRGAAVTDATTQLRDLPGGWSADGVSPVSLSAASATIEDCRVDGASKTLVVRFHVFGSRLPLRYVRLFDTPAGAGVAPAEAAGLAGRRLVKAVPTLAYTRADRLSGGVVAEARGFGVIESLSLRASGSSRGHDVDLAAAGTRHVDHVGLRDLDWRVAYQDAEHPIDGGSRLSRAFAAHLVANVADGPAGMLLRTGGAIARGRLGGDPAPNPLAVGTVAAAEVTSLKAFASAQWRGARQAAGLAYGLDASATGDGFGGGFTRQIVDGSWRVRVLPVDHKPIDVEARFGAGWIDNRGRLPLAARFFGGNTVEDFLPGANLGLRANPVIRSFASSELDRVSDDGPLGAERFVSINLTVAPTIWGRPLVPRELSAAASFDQQLGAGLSNAQKQLEQQFASEAPGFGAFVTTHADALRTGLAPAIDALADKFGALQSSAPERQAACVTTIDTVSFTLDDLTPADAGKALTLFRTLSEQGRTIDQLIVCVADSAFAPDDAVSTQALATLRAAKATMRQGLALTDERQSEARATAIMAPAHRVLDTFLHELNIASVAPVALVDACRIGPQPAGGPGFRYAIGGGLRLSLVNSLHLTAVYGWNPSPRPRERRGAVTVTLDVSELLF